MLRWTILATLAVSLPATPAAMASSGDCGAGVGLDSIQADCLWSYADYTASSTSGDGSTWSVTVQCANGGICVEYTPCTEDGQPGFVYDVYRDGEDVADVCVPESEQEKVDIAVAAARAFKRLTWPASRIEIQPPGGRTLVNLETIFYTENNRATTQAVTLIGRRVEIEATPASYTWDFGDGSRATTNSAGKPYPDHDIVHVYASRDEFEASVSTTYAGRFRVDGGGWRDIPETLTVAGPAVGLAVVEARPKLVG